MALKESNKQFRTADGVEYTLVMEIEDVPNSEGEAENNKALIVNFITASKIPFVIEETQCEIFVQTLFIPQWVEKSGQRYQFRIEMLMVDNSDNYYFLDVDDQNKLTSALCVLQEKDLTNLKQYHSVLMGQFNNEPSYAMSMESAIELIDILQSDNALDLEKFMSSHPIKDDHRFILGVLGFEYTLMEWVLHFNSFSCFEMLLKKGFTILNFIHSDSPCAKILQPGCLNYMAVLYEQDKEVQFIAALNKLRDLLAEEIKQISPAHTGYRLKNLKRDLVEKWVENINVVFSDPRYREIHSIEKKLKSLFNKIKISITLRDAFNENIDYIIAEKLLYRAYNALLKVLSIDQVLEISRKHMADFESKSTEDLPILLDLDPVVMIKIQITELVIQKELFELMLAMYEAKVYTGYGNGDFGLLLPENAADPKLADFVERYKNILSMQADMLQQNEKLIFELINTHQQPRQSGFKINNTESVVGGVSTADRSSSSNTSRTSHMRQRPSSAPFTSADLSLARAPKPSSPLMSTMTLDSPSNGQQPSIIEKVSQPLNLYVLMDENKDKFPGIQFINANGDVPVDDEEEDDETLKYPYAIIPVPFSNDERVKFSNKETRLTSLSMTIPAKQPSAGKAFWCTVELIDEAKTTRRFNVYFDHYLKLTSVSNGKLNHENSKVISSIAISALSEVKHRLGIESAPEVVIKNLTDTTDLSELMNELNLISPEIKAIYDDIVEEDYDAFKKLDIHIQSGEPINFNQVIFPTGEALLDYLLNAIKGNHAGILPLLIKWIDKSHESNSSVLIDWFSVSKSKKTPYLRTLFVCSINNDMIIDALNCVLNHLYQSRSDAKEKIKALSNVEAKTKHTNDYIRFINYLNRSFFQVNKEISSGSTMSFEDHFNIVDGHAKKLNQIIIIPLIMNKYYLALKRADRASAWVALLTLKNAPKDAVVQISALESDLYFNQSEVAEEVLHYAYSHMRARLTEENSTLDKPQRKENNRLRREEIKHLFAEAFYLQDRYQPISIASNFLLFQASQDYICGKKSNPGTTEENIDLLSEYDSPLALFQHLDTARADRKKNKRK